MVRASPNRPIAVKSFDNRSENDLSGRKSFCSFRNAEPIRCATGGKDMASISNLSRRALVKWGLASAGLPALSKVLASPALAQDAGPESGKIGEVGGRAESELYPGKGLPGGGQLEIRLTASIYTSDPD
jgi:hypothetical protein